MPKFQLPIHLLTLTCEDESVFAEALLFPDVVRYHVSEKMAQMSLRANLKKLLEEPDNRALHRLTLGAEPQLGEIRIALQTPVQSSARANDEISAWRRPIELTFHTVTWEHGEAARIVYVPALEIEVVATTGAMRAALDKLVERNIRAALVRDDSLKSPLALVWWDTLRGLTLAQERIEISTSTPKQIAARELNKEERKKSALAAAATNLTEARSSATPAAFEVDETLARLAETLTGRTPRSALLIGPSGVGKTAAVYELVRRRADFELGHTPFWETNGARLVAGMSGFGQWQERVQRMWQELSAARAILYVGNLVELTEVGKSVSNEQSIGAYLRPLIARGDVLVIAECTPEQAALLERADPRLLAAFQPLKVEEPNDERAKSILLNVALARRSPTPVIEFEALERLHALHRRYAGYSAQPGRPVRFLRQLLEDRAPGHTIQTEEINEAFSRETGLPPVLIDERQRLDAEAAREWFTARVAGQAEAVALVVDLLVTVKAGLVRPRKPIASLLFIGPTGVGKTEMAKSLAEFLFQDRGRMIRFDMSEYATPGAVSRLIGSAFGGSEQEGLLTAKVREQPFSVLLLDELEKAHASFADLLLQALGEGRLTDAAGRVADFSNTVVIMTSNLGAESFQRSLVGFGQKEATSGAVARHFTTAVRKWMRPELFNRIDRIVPFAPLGPATVLGIAARELDRIKQRDGLRFGGVELKLGDGVLEHLAARGYSPRYGARPLKRTIERELLVPLAEQLNSRITERAATQREAARKGDLNKPGHATLEEVIAYLEGDERRVTVRTNTGTAEPDARSESERTFTLARNCVRQRREVQAFRASPATFELQNEIFGLRKLQEQLARAKAKFVDTMQAARIAELPDLERTAARIAALSETINALERDLLCGLYGLLEFNGAQLSLLTERLRAVTTEWRDLLLTVYARRFKTPHTITLAFFCDDKPALRELAAIYVAALTDAKARVTAMRLQSKTGAPKATKKPADKKEKAPLHFERALVRDIDHYLQTWPEEPLGLLLSVSAPFAFPRLCDERGLHVLAHPTKPRKVLIETNEKSLTDYEPPDGLKLHGFIGPQPVRRTYDFEHQQIEDKLLDRTVSLKGRAVNEVLAGLLDEWLLRSARTMIE